MTISFLLLCLTAPGTSAEVEVISVRPPGDTSHVVSELVEALVSEPLLVHWQARSDLKSDDFLKASHNGPARPAAWIDLRDRKNVKIYFRDANAQRFFVRRLPEQNNDTILAEQAAQLLAPTFAALDDRAQVALTLDEIKSELPHPPPPIVAAHTTTAPAPRAVERQTQTRALALETTYAAHWLMATGAAAQGPRLRLSSRWNNRLGDVTVWTSVWKPLLVEAQDLESNEWSLSVWDWRFGLAFTIARTEDVAFVVGVGGGGDWVSGAPTSTVEAPRSLVLPALRWELRTELRLAAWLFGTLGVGLDAIPPTTISPPDATGAALRLATWQPGAWVGLEARTSQF
ncbi:MAG: hypothetical protein SF187_29490 [Deltaproteobacteria bacterium]|nr:hypothetical protein [Deltaproteobacteria bacterium]